MLGDYDVAAIDHDYIHVLITYHIESHLFSICQIIFARPHRIIPLTLHPTNPESYYANRKCTLEITCTGWTPEPTIVITGVEI